MSDEVARLREAIAALEEQRALLGDDVVDAAVANLAPQLEKAIAAAADQEQQRKQVTVLFGDVSGFTKMSETVDHEEVAERMNAIWERLDQVIVDHGGRVDKHIGDAVMGLWGAPVAREDDPERAVTAALEMQRALEEMNPSDSEHPLMMRIGLNTGPVLLGVVGSTSEYTAIGHTVNLASRLESAAPPGGVLISHDTYSLVSGLFNVVAKDPIAVKGVAEPVQTYEVRERKQRTFRVGAREVAGVATPLVGREVELKTLTEALPAEPVGAAPTRLITVIGEAGVGKSRLLYEFFNWLDTRPYGTYLFRGRATARTETDAYSLLRDIVFFRYQIADSDTPTQAKEKLEDGLAALSGDEARSWAPFIGQLIGLDYSDVHAVAELLDDPRLIGERAERHLRQAIASGVGDRYCVMLVEDIHWADSESLDLLERLAAETTAFPFLIVANARPALIERRPEWIEAEESWRSSVHLDPLEAADASALVDAIFRRMTGLPESLRSVIVERSGGNPFYLEELVKMLIDDGVISSGDEWKVDESRLAAARIPNTLTGVVQARVDSLSRSEKKALQDASVIGRIFWQDALVTLLQRDLDPAPKADEVGEWMDAGQRRELVYRQAGSDFADTREYIFKHAILHDVVYESVTRRARRAHHAAVASWLEQRASGRTGEFASRIADHYERAGLAAETAKWLLIAADQARQAYAPEAAIRDYQKAIELLRSDDEPAHIEQMMDALEGLGDALNTRGRYPEAAAAFEELAALANATSDGLALSRSHHGRAVASAYRGDFRGGLDAARDGAAMAIEVGDELLDIRCKWLQAWCLLRLGELSAAEETVAAVVTASKRLSNEAQLAKAQNLTGVLHYTKGNYGEATVAFEQAADTFRAMSSPESVMPILNNLGVLDEAQGKFDQAVARYTDALAIAREIGSRDGEMVYSSNLGMAKLGLGLTDEAETLFRAVIEMAEGELNVLSETYRGLAEALLSHRQLDEALAAALEALRLAIAAEATDDESGARRLLGLVAAARDEPIDLGPIGIDEVVDAAEFFSQAVTIAEADEDDAELARNLASWAGWLGGEGEDRLERAAEIFTSLGVTGELDRWVAAGRAAHIGRN